MAKRITAVLVGLIAVFSIVVALSADGSAKKPNPKQVVFEAKNGKVTYNHEAHEKRAKCETCHHMMATEKDKVACRSCHTDKAEGRRLAAKDAFHKACKGCHEEQVKADPNSKAPTKCNGCHVK